MLTADVPTNQVFTSLTPHPDFVLMVLEEYLHKNDLSLNAFAVEHQFNYKTLHNFVTGATVPRYETVEEIATILIGLGCKELQEDPMITIAGVSRKDRVNFLARAAATTLRPDQQRVLAMQILEGLQTR